MPLFKKNEVSLVFEIVSSSRMETVSDLKIIVTPNNYSDKPSFVMFHCMETMWFCSKIAC